MGQLDFKKITGSIDKNFSCGNASIDHMLQSAWFLTCLNRCYTYEISTVTKQGKKILGYYMLTFRHFNQNELKAPLDEYSDGQYTDIYAMHIECIAIDEKLHGHKFGSAAMQHIIMSAEKATEICPIRILSLSALDDLEKWYGELGFKKLDRDSLNPQTIVMYRDLLTEDKQLILEQFDEF